MSSPKTFIQHLQLLGPLEQGTFADTNLRRATRRRDTHQARADEAARAGDDAFVALRGKPAPEGAGSDPGVGRGLALLLIGASASFWLAAIVGYLFTKLTLTVDGTLCAVVAGLTVLVGTTGKAALTLVRLPREHELKDLSKTANRHALIASIASFVAFLGSTFSRSSGSLPLWVPLASFGGLEIGCAALAGTLFSLYVIQAQPGRLYAMAEREADLADEWAVVVEQLSSAAGEHNADSVNRGATDREGARRALTALPLAFLLAALISASTAWADISASELRVFFDKTPSASPEEVTSGARSFGDGLERLLASMPHVRTLRVYLWRGDVASSRTSQEEYDLPYVIEAAPTELESILPARGQYQRAKSAKELAEKRRPIIAAVRADLERFASARLAPHGASCVRTLLKAAQSVNAASLVISDCAPDGCKVGALLPKGDGSLVMIALVTRLGDGDLGEEKLQERLLKLRALGFLTMDATELASVNWSTVFEHQAIRPSKAGR